MHAIMVVIGSAIVLGAFIFAFLGKFAEDMSDAPGETMGAGFYLSCLAFGALGAALVWHGAQ